MLNEYIHGNQNRIISLDFIKVILPILLFINVKKLHKFFNPLYKTLVPLKLPVVLEFNMLNIQPKSNIYMYLPIKPTEETKNVVVVGNIQSINFEWSPYTAKKTLDTNAIKRER